MQYYTLRDFACWCAIIILSFFCDCYVGLRHKHSLCGYIRHFRHKFVIFHCLIICSIHCPEFEILLPDKLSWKIELIVSRFIRKFAPKWSPQAMRQTSRHTVRRPLRHAVLPDNDKYHNNEAFSPVKCNRRYMYNEPVIILVSVWRKSIHF